MHGEHKIPFYESSNKVILSEGLKEGPYIGVVPSLYFRSVFDFKNNKFLYTAPFEYICVFDFECTCEDRGGQRLL